MDRRARAVSLLALLALVGASGLAGASSGPKTEPASASGRNDKVQEAQVIKLSVTSSGFVPAQVKVKAGRPVKLVITRKTDRTCATEVVIKDYRIRKALPLNRAVEIVFTPTKPGTIRYACAMDMIAGSLVVQ